MALGALTYVFLLGFKGVLLLPDANLLVRTMGMAILVLPLFAIWAIWKEIRFGYAAEKLARANTLPQLNLELRPSGRATKESAAKELARLERELATGGWEIQFRYGEALEASGDRKAARAAIRRAIALANNP